MAVVVINDKTGRKLKEGQIVDIQLIGMFQGIVRHIKSAPIQLPGGETIRPHVIIDVVTTPFIAGNGHVPDVYIMRDPDPTSSKGSKLVTE